MVFALSSMARYTAEIANAMRGDCTGTMFSSNDPP